MRNAVFLDASFWINFRDEGLAPHPLVRQIVADLFRQRAQLVTTLPVVCEIHAYFSRIAFRRETILKELCENPVVRIEDVLLEDRTEAFKILRNSRDKDYSLCDALSFAVMRRLHLTRALAFDAHFRQFGGFEIIPDTFP